MEHLQTLENESIYIIREAYAKLKPLGCLWSMGKDSNVLLWLAMKAFFGKVPFQVILLDTGEELPEVYEFRDRYIQEWGLHYINKECPSFEATDPNLPTNSRYAARKTLGLKELVQEQKFQGIMAGIRRDEQAVRGKERFFSTRNNDGSWAPQSQPVNCWNYYSHNLAAGQHQRVHPLLNWSELDIWLYIKQEQIPVVPLYFAKDGMRYRSLGEQNITRPVASDAATIDEIIAELKVTQVAERSGRTMDNETESAFEQLRTAGYM